MSLFARRAAVLWIAIALVVGLLLFNWLDAFLTVDGCLDSGGRYNHESQVCERGWQASLYSNGCAGASGESCIAAAALADLAS